MSQSFKDIVQKVDAHVGAYPNVELPLLARRIGIEASLIEEAFQKIEGLSFHQYLEAKRLKQAFDQLGALSPAANGPYEIIRARRRLVIPRATVQYGARGFWTRKILFSRPCPLVDLSRDGLALLADHPEKPEQRLSLLLSFPTEAADIRVEGRVVYAVATGIAGYRYRIGVQFAPFSGGRGENRPPALDVLIAMEKKHGSRS